jgi:prepilin peptidase CpaA
MELARFFSLDNLPVWILCAALITAAAIDFWKLKVPNWLTFPLIVSGWLLGLGNSIGSGEWAFLGASFALTLVGLALLLPLYAIGGMGAGDVKMQMGFGSWVGAIYGLYAGFWIVVYAFAIAAVVGGAMALIMIWWRGDFRQNRKNVAEIVGDWFTSKSVYQVAEKAQARKPRMHLLPYGVPLCIGFVGYLLFISGG